MYSGFPEFSEFKILYLLVSSGFANLTDAFLFLFVLKNGRCGDNLLFVGLFEKTGNDVFEDRLWLL